MTAFNQFAPGSTKVTDGNGNATSAFQIWMRNVWLRGGGADALSAAELEALITTAQAEIDALEGVVAALQHDELGGLSDDDHPQYHNDARGDLRYQPLDADLTAIAALTTTAFGRALLALVGSPDMTSTAFGGLPSGTAFPVPQEVVVKQAGSWVRLAWADFLTAVSGVSSASLDFSQASNSQYIGAVYI